MKVLKFGGTSVGSVKSILSLKRIVENEAKKQSVVVVVSALGGITDKLLQTSQLALKGDELWKVEFEAMVDRHHKMIDTIITDTTDRENLFKSVDALFEQLKSIYFGVYLIHDLSEKTQDAIVSYGERLSSKIVATLIRGAKWFDSRNFIKTERKNGKGKHVLDSELTNKLVKEAFAEIPRISLVPGFISRDKNTDRTTLWIGGRAYRVESSRVQKTCVLVKLAGIDTVEAASALRDQVVSIDRADAQLPQGSIFIADLLGLPVYDGETPIGRLTDVMSTPANDVYVVKGEDGQEHLIPAVPEFVLERNVDGGYIRVRLIEGM